MSPEALRASLAAYNKDLLRSVLPVLVVCGVVMIGAAILLAQFWGRWTSPYKQWVLLAALIALVQLPLRTFFRNVRLLSAAHGLICPSCNVPLGMKYATLKRTGKCGKCGAQIVDAA
jgi:hypothetical protein